LTTLAEHWPMPGATMLGDVHPADRFEVGVVLRRRPFLLRYADGSSVVVNANSGEAAVPAELEAVVSAVHDIAAAAR
jgi:hypothetical protein